MSSSCWFLYIPVRKCQFYQYTPFSDTPDTGNGVLIGQPFVHGKWFVEHVWDSVHIGRSEKVRLPPILGNWYSFISSLLQRRGLKLWDVPIEFIPGKSADGTKEARNDRPGWPSKQPHRGGFDNDGFLIWLGFQRWSDGIISSLGGKDQKSTAEWKNMFRWDYLIICNHLLASTAPEHLSRLFSVSSPICWCPTNLWQSWCMDTPELLVLNHNMTVQQSAIIVPGMGYRSSEYPKSRFRPP